MMSRDRGDQVAGPNELQVCLGPRGPDVDGADHPAARIDDGHRLRRLIDADDPPVTMASPLTPPAGISPGSARKRVRAAWSGGAFEPRGERT